MLHENHSGLAPSSRAAAHNATASGKSMSAVPFSSQQDKHSTISPVIQRAPEDWAKSPQVSHVLQQPHGYFSTWKDIKAAINAYKILKEHDYKDRWQKLGTMQALIGTWKTKHVNDKTPRVQGIRGVLPGLEDLINHERLEIKTVVYNPGGSKYTSRTRRDVSFSIIKAGEAFRIQSEHDQISGKIQYIVRSGTIDLKHFEAQPEGLGLGTVLMYEFAAFAKKMGIAIVNVQTAAYSAMGAYEAFGGAPLAEQREAFTRLNDRFAAAMGLSHNRERGEHITEDHRDDTYDTFINEEAMAIGKTRGNRALFDNPEISTAEREELETTTARTHRERNVRNVENVKRVARLKALSSFLSYEIDALLETTSGRMAGKWDIEE